mgnify:CR=1 FL=1
MAKKENNFASCKITVKSGDLPRDEYDGLMIALFEGEDLPEKVFNDSKLQGDPASRIKELIKNKEIRGSFREFTIVHVTTGKKVRRVIVMGLGKRDDAKFDMMGREKGHSDNLDHLRSVCAQAARTYRRIGVKRMIFMPDSVEGIPETDCAEAAAEGVIMGLSKFPKFTQKEYKLRPFEELVLLVRNKSKLKESKEAAKRGETLGRAVVATRRIVNMPANIMSADGFEKEAKEVADSSKKIDMKVYREKDLKKMNYQGLLNVGAAGSQPPRLLELNYKGGTKSSSTICLVGKGVIYDSGGLGVKPNGGGAKMKYDMAGAALMLGTLRAIKDLSLPVNVCCLLPLAENLIDREAYRAGDILKMANGVCVEIHHTDAEGRLILADALCHAGKKSYDAIIDAATLTGTVSMALGHVVTGLMGCNQELLSRISNAGIYRAERHWQLPLFPEYGVHIKSTVADINNLGGRPAQTSTAALFLKHFVPEDTPWAHLDICGTAWIGEDTTQYFHKPYLPKRGATGHDVRTLAHTIEELVQDAKERNCSVKGLLMGGETKKKKSSKKKV